jgi:dynein heavy chain 1
MTRTL